jgi:hypothetical protein
MSHTEVCSKAKPEQRQNRFIKDAGKIENRQRLNKMCSCFKTEQSKDPVALLVTHLRTNTMLNPDAIQITMTSKTNANKSKQLWRWPPKQEH